MGESLNNGELKIREAYDPMWRPVFFIPAAISAAFGVFCGYGATDLYSSGESGLMVVGAALGMVLCFVFSYGLWRLDLELRISEKWVAARAWPFPWTRIPIDRVLTSEVVEIDPFQEYRGWGLKGTKRDRLIGGGGTTALRITYTDESGDECKLTFLTDRADEAHRRITSQRTR